MAFDNQAEAEQRALEICFEGSYMRAYYNKKCRWWHLTSQKPREQAAL